MIFDWNIMLLASDMTVKFSFLVQVCRVKSVAALETKHSALLLRHSAFLILHPPLAVLRNEL